MCGVPIPAQGKVLRMEGARLGLPPAWGGSAVPGSLVARVLWECLCRGGKQWYCGTGNMCIGNVGRQGCPNVFWRKWSCSAQDVGVWQGSTWELWSAERVDLGWG